MIKEKVLKEVFDEFFDRDTIEDAYVNSYLDEQIGNGLKKAIDLTLAERNKEVSKVIDEDEKYQKSKLTGDFEKDKAINWRLEGYKHIKQKLGIK